MSAACRAPQSTNRSRSRRPGGRGRATLLAAGAAAAALALSACGSGGMSGGSGNTNFVAGKDGISTAKKGDRKALPELDGETLDGEKLDIADAYKGKVLVINVWGSWCAPCRAEAPNFVKVAKEKKAKGVEFVGINTRDPERGPALAFEKAHEVPYPSVYDPTGKLMLRFPRGSLNPNAIPSTLVVDRDGKIAARTQQPLNEAKLRKMIDPVVAEK
ncbi:redoxin domain-containing protein [Streptomyces sp. WAC 01529]|uniref:TlpA family protein disulfide reductase n=1 Tax=Streptomyces sp. WAC 01529 TaxID=2203205 RepID=UPI000F6B4EC6|nr:TlpA disulfide reductase family protein [Streptomyces sp. WAC 01529]AZM54751.1 redoxin domain-containing protein [Streptomyces sp. WAC 01529]